MKKYLIFLLLLLVSIGGRAANVTNIQLAFDTRTLNEGSTEWYHRNVKDVSQIQAGDFIVVSYDKVTGEECQYAICDVDGNKIYTNGADQKWQCYTCPVGDTDFTFPIDEDLYKKIVTDGKGLQIQDKGLSGNMSISIIHVGEDWMQYKPANAIEIMSTPQYIKDWYNDGYVLKIDANTSYVGKTLRVVCLDTADDSYAFLKKNTTGWPSLMSGSDKFSIAGWKFFEIKINDELNNLLKGDGLRIGGNNYYIAGIYGYGSDMTAPAWADEESDVIGTYTFSSPLDGIANEWAGAKIPGSFFEFQGQGDQISTTKLANTKNNIIRIVFDDTAGESAQVSAKDANPTSTSGKDDVLKDANDNYASYIRQRNYDETSGFYYVDYADCEGEKYFDFELSDDITLFKDYNHPVVDNDDKAPGVKKGMLSTLLQNGMVIGANKVKVKAVQIRKSMVSKYVTGCAVYKHNLSKTVWRPISLPYNLTQEQVKNAFGDGTKICELGPSKVTKKEVEEGKVSNSYAISLSFQEVTGDVNADYPYIIKVGNVQSDNLYKIESVKADVRDFQAYEFRTGKFDVSALDATEPTAGSADYNKNKEVYDFEQRIKDKLTDDVYMVFQSTAPVFNITNTNAGNVEIINGVDNRTTLTVPAQNTSYYNYYFYDGALWPVLTEERKLASGLAYIKFPAATKGLFDDAETEGQSSAKVVCLFPDDNSTTGIDDVVALAKKQMPVAIYNLAGQLIRKGTSMGGLAKGIYVVNGKKVTIK